MILIMVCIGIATVSALDNLAHNSLRRFVAGDLRRTSAAVSAEKVNLGEHVSVQVTQHLNLDPF